MSFAHSKRASSGRAPLRLAATPLPFPPSLPRALASPLVSRKRNPLQLWHLARKVAGDGVLVKAAAEKESGGKALVLDVNQQGIFKVLGKGLMPELPIVVKARYVSKLAEEKIRAAGGAVILTA